MNGLLPFESTIEQTTETMRPSPKTITATATTTNRITSLRELLHYRVKVVHSNKLLSHAASTDFIYSNFYTSPLLINRKPRELENDYKL